MKKLIGSLILLAMLPLSTFAQGINSGRIPQNVESAFSQKYPQASVRHWMVKAGDYKVKFRDQGKEYEASFAGSGAWERTEHRIALTKDLPGQVRQAFRNSDYGACNIDGIAEVRTPDRHYYRIRVDNGNYFDAVHHDNDTENYTVRINPDGTLLPS